MGSLRAKIERFGRMAFSRVAKSSIALLPPLPARKNLIRAPGRLPSKKTIVPRVAARDVLAKVEKATQAADTIAAWRKLEKTTVKIFSSQLLVRAEMDRHRQPARKRKLVAATASVER